MKSLSIKLTETMHEMDARLLRVVVTAGASYFGRFGAGLAVLVTLPMARRALDPELFGVWMMLSALFGFMAFADLGVGNGVLNNITQARASRDDIQLRRTLLAGYACTGSVGVALALGWLAWAHCSSDPTVLAGAINPAHRGEVLAALSAFALVLAVNIPASLVQRVQLGMQEGYWNGIAQFIGAMATMVAVPLTLRHGGGVDMLVFATVGVQAAVNVANTVIWLGRRQLLGVRCWRGTLHAPTLVKLLSSGVLFFLLQASAAFAFQSDAIVISQTLGQAAYGNFAVVQKLFLFVSMLLTAAMVGLWPAFGDAIASGNMTWVRKVLRRGILAAGGAALLASSALALAMPWILSHWMHTLLQPVWTLLLALATLTVMDAMANVLGAFMNGANILRAQLFFAVTMASTAFGAKWLLTPLLGATGAVLSTILAYCLISVPGQIFIFRKAFRSKE